METERMFYKVGPQSGTMPLLNRFANRANLPVGGQVCWHKRFARCNAFKWLPTLEREIMATPDCQKEWVQQATRLSNLGPKDRWRANSTSAWGWSGWWHSVSASYLLCVCNTATSITA